MNPDNELWPKRKDLCYVPDCCCLALLDECGAGVASGFLQKPGPSSAFPPEAAMSKLLNVLHQAAAFFS